MRKILKTISVVLVLSFVVMSSVFAQSITEARKRTVGETIELQIISTSDGHGKFLPFDYAQYVVDRSGSLAQVSTAVSELRNDNTILIDVGDTIQGNSADLFLYDDIHPMVRAQNLMQYDVWVPGNHEFNYGMDVLRNVIDQHESAVLCGNVYYPDGKCIADNYVIIERGGLKIGIIGMVTPNIVKWDKANLDRSGIIVTDPVEEIKAIVDYIRDDVDLIIAAVHMDVENEYGVENSGAYDLADKVPGIDLILAAHGHQKINSTHNNVLITENNDVGKTISVINMTVQLWDDGRYHLIDTESELIDMASYDDDPLITEDEIIMEADRRAKEDAQTVIGYLVNESLAPADEIKGIAQAKLEPTALINLINDVQMYYTGAEISGAALFIDSANMYRGDIKKCDMALVYKYANTLYKLKMTGAQLKKWMEWSYSYFNTFQDGDLTISFDPNIRGYNYDMFSGVMYEADISQPAGNRIYNLRLADGSPLEMDEWYVVAVNNYRANSQLLSYGSVFFEGEELPQLLEIDVRGDIGGVRELIGDYIVNVKGQKDENGIAWFSMDDVTPENANWKLTGYSWDEEKHSLVADLVNNGFMSLKNSQDGRYTNVSSITEADLDSFLF